MKKIKLILSCIVLLSCLSIVGQNNGRYNNGSETESEKEKRKESMEKAKAKNIELTMAQLKTDLELDDLQFIAIKQIITESVRIEGIILAKEDESDENKMKSITALSDTTDTKIKALLNKTQIEKFIEFKNAPKKKKKK